MEQQTGRNASEKRETRETTIAVALEVDGSGNSSISTGVGFFDHMLELLSTHSLFDLTVEATGDTQVDDHHTVEDVGIALGHCLDRALGDRGGIVRFADVTLPMDEARAHVTVDVSGRGHLVYQASYPGAKIGQFDVELVEEFLGALASNARLTLHVQMEAGTNGHHIAEAIFKGLAVALRRATRPDPDRKGKVPSSKGII